MKEKDPSFCWPRCNLLSQLSQDSNNKGFSKYLAKMIHKESRDSRNWYQNTSGDITLPPTKWLNSKGLFFFWKTILGCRTPRPSTTVDCSCGHLAGFPPLISLSFIPLSGGHVEQLSGFIRVINGQADGCYVFQSLSNKTGERWI